jgi:hypothetical protein
MKGEILVAGGTKWVADDYFNERIDALDEVNLLYRAYPGIPIFLDSHEDNWIVYVGKDYLDKKLGVGDKYVVGSSPALGGVLLADYSKVDLGTKEQRGQGLRPTGEIIVPPEDPLLNPDNFFPRGFKRRGTPKGQFGK